ncbi:hypothetical protein BJ322DRAFT_1107369 [Thelephora terrestris]|uniref:Uncharacterized protein n=1 Tax=Thelephora terrestris TaxID=56493 RepID=A0A9P6HI29_9AGAM|nr:hypothetical protein BJ322DRAFT_1107369 [Thelephora terrestris]
MSQHNSQTTLTTSAMPVVSDLFASYSDAQGFWVKDNCVPTTKNEGEATTHPHPSSLLRVDIARELRSARYSRNKAKNVAKSARAQGLKRQGRYQRGHPTQRSRGGKGSGKRQSIPQDLESDYEEDISDRPSWKTMSEDRPISASISPESQSPTKKSPKGSSPPGTYTTGTLPESTFDIPAPDIAREFRSYERHRHQTKKNARFTQFKQRKGVRVKPIPNRCSKSVKAEMTLVNLTIIDEGTSSEDEIQTPVEVSLSLLSDAEFADPRAPLALDMEALIASAKVKYTKEPSFEFVKRVREVVALDDCTSQEDDDESWEHVWNDNLID